MIQGTAMAPAGSLGTLYLRHLIVPIARAVAGVSGVISVVQMPRFGRIARPFLRSAARFNVPQRLTTSQFAVSLQRYKPLLDHS